MKEQLFLIHEFVLSDEGRKILRAFRDRFLCAFFIEAIGDSVLMETDDNTCYFVPEWETAKEFQATLEASIEQGHNLFLDRYKGCLCPPHEDGVFD